LLPDLPARHVIASRDGRAIQRDQFLAEVACLAARLPAVAEVINLCQDRYWFAVAFAACVSRGIVSLLPHSSAIEALTRLARQAPQAWLLVDGDEVPPLGLSSLQVPEACVVDAAHAAPHRPQVAAEQHVATVYTSGSTGLPQAHDKRWACVQASVVAAARRIWAAAGGPCSVIGTPSFRHMYGLESTVLLPLLGGGCLTARQPFFPADVAAALEEAPEPRLLVTTPFHLRKLMESGVALPRVAALLSATAPLAPDIARAAETSFNAPLLEIYGATEVGQIATRRPCVDDAWDLLDGNRLTEVDGATILAGTTQPQPQALNDVLELLGPARFRLVDRAANLINIVGKRTSLGHLNHLLTQIPGVHDGVFCLPEHQQTQDDARLAAFVVAPGLSAADILAAMRPLVDAVFLPRPLVLINALSRDVNGKVAAATLRQLVDAHLPSGP
jgi:acyl-coenzyme A synthetase/AMP-(fatty) acid ligase